MTRYNNSSILLILLLLIIYPEALYGQKLADANLTKEMYEGELVYDVSGAGTIPDSKFSVKFNKDNIKIFERDSEIATNIYLIDKSISEVCVLRDEFRYEKARAHFFSYNTLQELQANSANLPYGDPVKIVTREYKTIMGFKCRKIVFKMGRNVYEELWVTDKIKTGAGLPYTPLTMSNAALESKLVIFGSVNRKYVIRSISNSKIPLLDFEPVIPDEYLLSVPAHMFEIDTAWAGFYRRYQLKSLEYPAPGKERTAIMKYLTDSIFAMLPENELDFLDLTVLKDGSLGDVEINGGSRSPYLEGVRQKLSKMPKWTPAKVKGKAVNARISVQK
jgi:hypothetical protein